MPPCRLDGLPDAAARNVIRHLSSAPSKPNWQSFVEGTNALLSIQLDGAIAVAARDLFTRIHIGRPRHRDRAAADVGTVFLALEFPCILGDAAYSRIWMHCAGASLTSLQLRDISNSWEGML